MLAPQQTIVPASANFHREGAAANLYFLYFERPIYLAVNAVAISPQKTRSQPRTYDILSTRGRW